MSNTPLEEIIEYKEGIIKSYFQDCNPSDLESALNSFNNLSKKLIEKEYSPSINNNLLVSLHTSVRKNRDPEELVKLCDLYSICSGVGPDTLNYATRCVRTFQKYSIIKECFDDFSNAYFDIEEQLRENIVILQSIYQLSKRTNPAALKQYYSFIINHKEHKAFDSIIRRLSNAITILNDNLGYFTSCLSKLPEILLYSEYDSKNGSIYFKEIREFNQEIETYITDSEMKNKFFYSEMNLIKETAELIMSYVEQVDQKYFGASQDLDYVEDLFLDYLNESISCGETLEEKRRSMSSWCREVQRMMKSGAYDDDLRLMFGGLN